MPSFDVTDIILDPDYLDFNIWCIRQVQTVGENGMATNAQKSTKFAGVVTSAGGHELQRGPTGERISQGIMIITKFRLIDGRGNNSADIVKWNGDQYTVTNVDPYTNYGRGFVQARCELIPLTG